MSQLVCTGHDRRREVRRRGSNGLDYLEVSDDQLTLTVTFLGKAPDAIDIANVVIEGGRRVRGIRVEGVRLCREDDPDLDDCMQVSVDRPGDFSTYTLRLVDAASPDRPMSGMDVRYASLDFSFKAGCPSDLDCATDDPCPPALPPEPDISYLAKDYQSFRSLILDRLAVISPEWTERHAPDLGIALVELLAYVGDQLSYQQDAVATEAYLDTARLRVSVRRHARLVDYTLHDGCNARAWVCVEVEGEQTVRVDASDVCFVTAPDATAFGPEPLDCDALRALVARGGIVYEPVREPPKCDSEASPGERELRFDPRRNVIHLWTWGDSECCLPAGATRATLKDSWVDDDGEQRALSLRPGDVIVFEERVGPRTGNPADANPTHRQAVRLTSVAETSDPLYDDQPLLEVAWAQEDALDFAVCISTFGGEDCAPIEDVTVVWGNVVLVDHGATVGWCDGGCEELPPRTSLEPGHPTCDCPCTPTELQRIPAPYRPPLRRVPVTQVTPFPDPSAQARRQAEVVAAIPGRVNTWIEQLVSDVRDGAELGERRRAQLATLFGARALADAGISRAAGAEQELEPLERLVGRADHLLADKEERTRALAERARDRDVLLPVVVEELTELWGDEYADAASMLGPAVFGPARRILAQDPRAALPTFLIHERPVPEPSNSQDVHEQAPGNDDSAEREPGEGPSSADRAGGAEQPSQDGSEQGWCWEPRRDLLRSAPSDRHVVGEVDDDGTMHLRFGPGAREVPVGAPMTACYRVGNGRAGNVGPEAISRIVLRTLRGAPIMRVRNPLAAVGGIDPEPVVDARLAAPRAFRRVLERAVTADDYAALAAMTADVQRAAARLRWTGSWFEAHVGLDPLSGALTPDALPASVETRLEPFRRLGHDLAVADAVETPLDVALTVCVASGYRADVVREALLDVLSNRTLPDGTHGFFHPDVLSFGTDIRLSSLVAVAQAVAGIDLVQVTKLCRLGSADGVPAAGVLAIGPLEIPELLNDPNQPGRGRLTLEVRGGL